MNLEGPLGFRKIMDAARNEGVVCAVLTSLLGYPVRRLNDPFWCPLPGHDCRRRSRSAALYVTKDGYLKVYCFHPRKLGEPEVRHFNPAEVVRIVVTGTLRLLKKRGETAVWWMRGLEEAGLLHPPYPSADPLPAGAPAFCHKVYTGFLQLVALRACYEPNQPSTLFTLRFACDWCGVTFADSVSARRWLKKHGYLVPAPPIRIGNRDAHTFTLGHPVSRLALLKSPERASLQADDADAPTIGALGEKTM